MGNGAITRYLVVGLGNLGRLIVLCLSQLDQSKKIVIATRTTSNVGKFLNLIRLISATTGSDLQLSLVEVDLKNAGHLAEIIHKENPDVIVHCATRLTWWFPDLFPKEVSKLLWDVKFGGWLPLHLDLAVKLSVELRDVGFAGHSLIGSYPDVVNQVLSTQLFTPTSGFGNIDEVVAKIVHLASKKYNCSHSEIDIAIVGHHSLSISSFNSRSRHPPYYLTMRVGGWPIENRVLDELISSTFVLPPRPSSHILTAMSALKIIKALQSDEPTRCFVSGPLGLPGGYTTTIQNGKIVIELPDKVNLEQAIQTNVEASKFDGIQKVESDGTVRLCADQTTNLYKAIGYDMDSLSVNDVEEKADEIVARIEKLALKSNVNLLKLKKGRWPN